MENECVRPQGGNSIMRFARNRGSQFAILHFPLNRHDFFILVSKHIFNLFDILIMDFL